MWLAASNLKKQVFRSCLKLYWKKILGLENSIFQKQKVLLLTVFQYICLSNFILKTDPELF